MTELKTPLYDLHLELGAKMVPFAGYAMPVQYPLGVLKEHLHTRERAGLFDVSHMGQLRLKGPGIAQALEAIIPVNLSSLPLFKQVYGVFTLENGGILDDLIITRWAEDEFFLVVNAGCKTEDIAHLQQHLAGFELEVLNDRALIALQGPQARAVMDDIMPASSELRFMSGCWSNINLDGESCECFITCSGYTGEDGFEISVPADKATALAKKLLNAEQVAAIGLGARDSLRLEVGLCLYGHDLDTDTSPVEAGLNWSISPSRRKGGDNEGGFPGADIILKQMAEGPIKKRIGLKAQGRAPVREGTELVNEAGIAIGKVCSGGFSPTLSAPIAMAYIDSQYTAEGTAIYALLRGKKVPMDIVKMPFVAQNYVR